MATDPGPGGLARRPRMDEGMMRYVTDADRRLQSLHAESPGELTAPTTPAETVVPPPRAVSSRPRPAARAPKPRTKSKPKPAVTPKARFHERVDRKVVLLSAPDHRMRTVFRPVERLQRREADRREAVWLPIWAVLTVATCTVVAAVICTQLLDVGDNLLDRATCGVVVIGAVAACVAALIRIQAYYQQMRPPGRTVPRDIADAYDVVRDAPELLAGLGLPADRLGRVYDLLPSVEPLVDFLAQNAAASPGALRASSAYRQLIRAAAEVHVLIETCEERLGFRPPWSLDEPAAGSSKYSLADLAEMIVPRGATSGPTPSDRPRS